jgi:3-dehydroquinate synthetase
MTQSFSANFDNYKKTWSVQTELPISFTVQYSSDVFNPKNHDLLNCGSNNSNRRIIVIDRNVYKLYSNQLVSYFEQLKVDGKVLIIDSDEENKTWDNANKILQFFETEGLLRREPVIAIGGGVLLDIVGYCASIYRRGVPYIKVPTTLLAIVDASVGAKVAVNHFDRRNRIGAYYPAIATLIDKRFIATQSEREIVNGIAEILKLAIIKDAELFELLETNYETLINEKFLFGAVPVRVINLAITGMIEELAPNLWEKKLDRCVDFGHTFSPIIEMQNIPNLLHGEAVILDCLFSSCIAYNRTYLSAKDLDRIFTTTKNLKLPIFHEDFTKIELLLKSLSDTMKHRNGNQYLPLPLGIGNYKIINDLTNDEIQKAINTFSQYKE